MADEGGSARAVEWIERVTDMSGRLACLLVIPLVILLNYEVLSRYLFNRPTAWTTDVAQYLFGAMFLIGGAYTLGQNGHVRVDVLHEYVSPKTRRLLDLFSYVVVAMFLSVLLVLGVERAWETVSTLERHVWSVWEPYLFPVIICIPVSAALMLLRLGAMTWRRLKD